MTFDGNCDRYDGTSVSALTSVQIICGTGQSGNSGGFFDGCWMDVDQLRELGFFLGARLVKMKVVVNAPGIVIL